jgi:uncharacterized protein YqhQ
MTPVISAVAYEILRASQSWEHHPVLRFAQKPDLWLQKLTTRDPDDDQIELAIAALNAALAYEAAIPGEVPAVREPVAVEAEIDAQEPLT